LVVDLEGIDSGFEEAEHGLFSSRDHGGSGSRRACDRETLRKELASRAKRKRDERGSGAEARRSGLAQSGQVALNPKWGQSWGAPDEGGRGDNARHGTGCSIEIQSSIPPRVAYAQCASAGTIFREYAAPIDEFGAHGNVNLARGSPRRHCGQVTGQDASFPAASAARIARHATDARRTVAEMAGAARLARSPDAPGQLRYGPRARSIYATTGARRRSKLVALVLHNSRTPRHGLGQRARSKSFFARRRTPHPAGAELGLTRLSETSPDVDGSGSTAAI
jgi:hypothetical protein